MEVQKVAEELSELSLNPGVKKSGPVVDVKDGNGKGEKKSLQEAFERFRKRKVETLKSVEKPIVPKDRKSPEFKSYLRAKFVETAKKYIGTPYAKRFLAPDHPNYNAKLFLDCCALVRQSVEDLKHEFGFMIPRLNQGYQFDTLPISIKFEELQPGDLIFYHGTYLSKNIRRQAHDLVHVEIFLGGGPTGEETLASRYNNGSVSLFPSYKFKSTLYTDVKHTYKSIDTWLDGILMNHCKDHHWVDKPLLLRPDKKSIFCSGNDAENVENCEVNAEDFEEDGEMPAEPAPLE